MHGRQASPIDKGAEQAAIGEVTERRLHPGEVEGQEFRPRHFARRHGELPVGTDIVHPDGKLSRNSSQVLKRSVIAKVNRALHISHDKGWVTALVKVGFAPGYVNQPKDSPFFGNANKAGTLELGTKGTEFHPDLEADLADVVVIKPRVSAFYCTDLESVLRASKVERLVLAGVSTA